MLWQKQLVGGEQIYIDILKDKKFDMRKCKAQVDSEFAQTNRLTTCAKDDATSTKFRQEGNDLFIRRGDIDAGILKYNKAILLAEADTENMGMCYANRSACFFRLKKYSMCLRDIDLAKKNGYPIRLFAKVDERKAKCLKLLQQSDYKEPQCVEAKLSFPPIEKNPGLANEIEVKHSPNGDKRTFAKCSLEIGQTVIIEEPFQLASEFAFNASRCSNCFRTDANLIPCKNCTIAMFCSQKCYDDGHEKFHYIECGINYRFIEMKTLRRSVLRTIAVAIQTFGTIEVLMGAIDLFNKEKKVDESDEAKRNYFKFFGSRRDTENLSQKQELELRTFVLSMQTILTNDSILKPMFSSLKNQRFLGHLILHHFYVVNRNSFEADALAEHTYKAELGVFNPLNGQHYASFITLDGMHMKHSCVPNIARLCVRNKIIYRVIRLIKSGEELFISYLHPLSSLLPRDVRMKMLSANYPLECDCVSCTSGFPPFKEMDFAVFWRSAYRTDSNTSAQMLQLLSLLDGHPQKFIKRVLSADRVKLEEYEKLIIKYLQHQNDLHPKEITLKLQFFLAQIWSNLLAVCHQG